MHLLACSACHRQYDVSHLEPGDHVRCACEAFLTVERSRLLNAHALRCAHCGAAVSAADETCGHCTARLSAASRLATTLCPECFTRLAEDARLCSRCGVDIQPNRLSALPHGTSCPRCNGELANRFLGHYDVIECQACQGVWVVPETFERLCEKARTHATAPLFERPSESTAPDALRYVPCVQCAELMNRRQFRWRGRSAGVVIDSCRDHGLWLDGGELRRILEFVRRAGDAGTSGGSPGDGPVPALPGYRVPDAAGGQGGHGRGLEGATFMSVALEALGELFLGSLF